jgi:hypothetical protein
MVLAIMMLSLIVPGQDAWPGSKLSLEEAKAEASLIVVAKVITIGDILHSDSEKIIVWTDLELSRTLKGEVTEEDLNDFSLAIKSSGTERLPKLDGEYVFFLGNNEDRSVITKLLPKTAANLAAIEAAKPPAPDPEEIHGLRVFKLGGFTKDRKPMLPPQYKGTKILPTQGAAGEMLKVQDEFAAEMARADPQPRDRQEHFAWLDRNGYVRHYHVIQIGWYGSITEVEPRREGGWLVKLTIHPWLCGARHSLCLDSVEETYEFVGGRVRLVGSNAAIAEPRYHVFPIAY